MIESGFIVTHKTVILHIKHSMSHTPSLFYPSHLSTYSLSTSTPVRPSTRPSTRLLLMSYSHGDLPCGDPSTVSFGPMAETHSPTDQRGHARAGLLGARCHADLASGATPLWALQQAFVLSRGLGAWSKVVHSGTKTAC